MRLSPRLPRRRESKRHLFVVDFLDKHIPNEKELIRPRRLCLRRELPDEPEARNFACAARIVTLQQGGSRRRQNCALLARVVRAAGKGAADELAPSHSVYAYPKNPPQINVAWIPAAEAAVD